MHFSYFGVRLLPHPLNPSSSINPLQKPATGSDIHQHHPSCFAMFPQSQGNSSIYGSWSAGKAGGKWREGRRSGIEWGSIEWKDGEGVFFGKGANPITSSGAALVSLAAQNSHFDGLFLPPLVPSCFFFWRCLFLLLCFLFFAHRGSHSHPVIVHPYAPHPSLSPSVCLSWMHERAGGIALYHQQSNKSCHPSCVMLRSAESLQHPTPCRCLMQLCRSLSSLCSGNCSSYSLGHPIPLPSLCHGMAGQAGRRVGWRG